MDSATGTAVVLGGHVNGFSIIRELHKEGVRSIWLMDARASLSSKSNRIIGSSLVEPNARALLSELRNLAARFGQLVAFPTSDLYLELLDEVHDEIAEFCFLPFNHASLRQSLDKSMQYAHCERLGVPCPRTRRLACGDDYGLLSELSFPLLLKPTRRDDTTTSVFRSLLVDAPADLEKHRYQLDAHMREGIEFVACELVPGDDTVIYAYTAYRSRHGEILNEWTGKKLTQFPDRFGVFSSASNEAPPEVLSLGRTLVNGMDLHGIVEPEFKFDAHDGKFKLMEVNLRSMMWHRVGNLCGVCLQHTQWLDALGMTVPRRHQDNSKRVHFVYMKHEVANLLTRRGYWKHFKHNVFGGDERHFAVFDRGDMRPFFYDLARLPRTLVGAWLRRLRAR